MHTDFWRGNLLASSVTWMAEEIWG